MGNLQRSVLVVAALGFVLGSATAMGSEAGPEAPSRKISVTWSPYHLVLGAVELTEEVRVGDRHGLAFVTGLGRKDLTSLVEDNYGDPYTETITPWIFELGMQYRWYAIGHFDKGMQVGAELLYVYLTQNTVDDGSSAGALGITPFIGYKIATQSGFTFDVQGGVGYMVAKEYYSYRGVKTTTGLIPVLNLNIGWSF